MPLPAHISTTAHAPSTCECERPSLVGDRPFHWVCTFTGNCTNISSVEFSLQQLVSKVNWAFWASSMINTLLFACRSPPRRSKAGNLSLRHVEMQPAWRRRRSSFEYEPFNFWILLYVWRKYRRILCGLEFVGKFLYIHLSTHTN